MELIIYLEVRARLEGWRTSTILFRLQRWISILFYRQTCRSRDSILRQSKDILRRTEPIMGGEQTSWIKTGLVWVVTGLVWVITSLVWG